MKLLLLVAVVLGVLWLLRSRKPGGGASSASGKSGRPSEPTHPMVSCAHCGVHLPREDAVAGGDGLYCSDAHRRARGDGG